MKVRQQHRRKIAKIKCQEMWCINYEIFYHCFISAKLIRFSLAVTLLLFYPFYVFIFFFLYGRKCIIFKRKVNYSYNFRTVEKSYFN